MRIDITIGKGYLRLIESEICMEIDCIDLSHLGQAIDFGIYANKPINIPVQKN